MRRYFRRRLGIFLAAVMMFTLIPTFEIPAQAEEVEGTAEMNAIEALGIDTDEAPEGYDANSTSNPYGKNNITVNEVSEVLLIESEIGTKTFSTTEESIEIEPNNADDHAMQILKIKTTITPYYVKSTLYGDEYKTIDGNVEDLFDTNKNELKKTLIGSETIIDITGVEVHTSPAGIEIDLDPVGIEYKDPFVAASATAQGNFNGNSEGKKAQVVMVSTNKLDSDGGLYLSFGEYSDKMDSTYGYFGDPKVILDTDQSIGNSNTGSGGDLNEDFENNPYMMQNYLKVSTGDYDNDGTDEVAVFVPSLGNSRVEIYKLKTTSYSLGNLEYFGNPDNWGEPVWTYPLSETDYVSNMVSLTSEDFNQDGVDDLAIAWGYYYGPENKKGGTSAVLFGSESSMLQESTTFPLEYEDSDIVRASFAYGDIMGDGSGQLILGGQLNSDIDDDNLNTRIVTVYSWDGQDFKPTLSQNFDLYDHSTVGGQTVYTYGSLGISDSYKFYSQPVCVSNLAVISRGLSESSMLYFDSMEFTYGDSGLSLTGVRDHENGIGTSYAEYSAQSGDLIGLGYDTVFTMQCELPKTIDKNPPIFSIEWFEILLGLKDPTFDRFAATYFNGFDYNPESDFTIREVVDHSASLCLPNTDDNDTSFLKYTGNHYFTYTDPNVMGVLASPPYFKDLIDRGDLSGSYDESETSYSESIGLGGGVTARAALNYGFYVSCEQDIEIFGIKVGSVESEDAITFGLTWETKFSTDINQTVEYSAPAGGDVVALFSIPTEVYEYESQILDSETGQFVTQLVTVNIPHTAAVRVMPVETYNKIASNFDVLVPIDEKILEHTVGNPSSYPSNKTIFDGAIVYPGNWAAVGYGGGGIKQEIEMSTTLENSFEASVAYEGKAGAGVGGVKVGKIFGAEAGAGVVLVVTSGSTYSGTLQNMPSEAEEFGYYHVWKLFYYTYFDGKEMFPVVSYLVRDVMAPPELPSDFEQNIKKTTENQIALRWSYDKAAAGFQIYRYYEFPDGAGSYELPFVSMKDGVYDSATGTVYFEFIDTGLAPYTDYSYQIQTVRSSIPNKSIKSETKTFRTKSDVGYPELLLYSNTDESFNFGDEALTLKLFPDSTNTVKVIVENVDDYPEGVNYQWQKIVNGKWADILGKKSSQITFSGSGESDEGVYRCRTNVIYYDSARGNTYYISSYTDSFATMYSKREPVVSDNGGFTVGVDSGNIPNISLTLESANMNHRAAPTGNVVFTIDGANYLKSYTVNMNVGETRYSTAVLDSSTKNSIGQPIATDLPEGVYEITANYSGSRVFKSLAVENDQALNLLVGESGYRLTFENDGEMTTEFSYGDTVSALLRKYSRIEGTVSSVIVEEGVRYSLLRWMDSGVWEEVDAFEYDEFDTPDVGSYRLDAISTDGDEVLARKEFTVVQKSVSIEPTGDKSAAVGDVEQYLPVLSLSPDSTLAFDETLDDLGLYIIYTNTAGNEVTMGNDSHVVTSIINGEEVDQTISGGTPAGSYEMKGTAKPDQSADQQSALANYDITFIVDKYIVTGTKYEVKLTSKPVEDRVAGTVEIISPEEVSSTYGAGTSLTVLAKPYNGYAVKQWIIYANGNVIRTQPGGTTLSYTMKDEPIEIATEFMVPDNTLTVSSVPTQGGTVSWTDTYFTNGTKVAEDANITFTAVPTEGLYHFVKWQKIYAGLTTDIYDQVYNFTMGDAPTMLYAIFERDGYTLSLGDNLCAYYMYDDDGDSRTDMVMNYVEDGGSVGGDTEITVEPKIGYMVESGDYWYVNNVKTLHKGSSYTFTILEDTKVDVATEGMTFDVEFSIDEPDSAGNGVRITLDGDEISQDELTDIDGGLHLVFSAEPEYGYVFKQWNITANPSTPEETAFVSTEEELIIAEMGADMRIEAVFIDNMSYEIKAAVNLDGIHGSIKYILNDGAEQDVPDGAIKVFDGDSVKLTAYPDNTFMVDKWDIDGNVWSTPETEYILEDIDQNHDIRVDFKSKAYYTVTYDVNDANLGQIDGMSDGLHFNSGYSDMGGGSKLVFTATPEEGYMIESWTVNNEIVKNTYGGNFKESILAFTLGKNCDVIVNFAEIITHTVTVDSPHATVTAVYGMESSGGDPVHGTTGIFTIEPKTGYRVTGVEATGSKVSQVTEPLDKDASWTVIIGSIIENTTITVETKPTYIITTAAENGTVTCVDSAVEGEIVELTADADTGYKFSEWSVTYSSISGNGSVQVSDDKFTMPAGDVTVTAVFKKSRGGGGFSSITTDDEIGPDDIYIEDGIAMIILTASKYLISEEGNLRLIELNESMTVIITGNGLRIVIPEGVLKEGDDVNDMIPELSNFTDKVWVVAYVDESGNRNIVPWSITGDNTAAFIAPVSGIYEVVDNGRDFEDIAGHWAEDAIKFLTARKLFMGTGDNIFSADINMNRAMLVTVIHRLDGMELEAGMEFIDVADGQWYSAAVSWATARDIIKGYGNGNFGPDNSITREQLVTIIYRYAEYTGTDMLSGGGLQGFMDSDQVSDYALQPMAWAVETGLVKGLPGGYINPDGNATRAEVAEILMRFINMIVE
jgi:hypothetical protein